MDSNHPGKVKQISVVGLGYVGLPLAVAFAKHHKVIGYDTNRSRVAELRERLDTTKQIGYNELREVKDRLTYCEFPSAIQGSDFFIITVPTPVDAHNVPDLSCLAAACETVGRALTKGAIVVFESTVYPGCTEDYCVPILEKVSGRKLNQDFYVGYSPERVNPGDSAHTLSNVTKVVSGSTPKVMHKISELYFDVTESIHEAPSIRVAEAAKAIENAQRDINIAFVNELAMMFDRMGISTQDVLAAARTKWNFLDFKPGLVGGHCIGVDPYYLAHAAVKHSYHTEMILAGRRTNESVAPFVARKLIREMRRRGRPTSRVLVLGLTFKENCPDRRNSKVPDLIRELVTLGCLVYAYDPVATVTPMPEGPWDGIVVAVAHDAFKMLEYDKLKTEGTVLLDVKGVVPDQFVDLRL